jgi:hypothetical protein
MSASIPRRSAFFGPAHPPKYSTAVQPATHLRRLGLPMLPSPLSPCRCLLSPLTIACPMAACFIFLPKRWQTAPALLLLCGFPSIESENFRSTHPLTTSFRCPDSVLHHRRCTPHQRSKPPALESRRGVNFVATAVLSKSSTVPLCLTRVLRHLETTFDRPESPNLLYQRACSFDY